MKDAIKCFFMALPFIRKDAGLLLKSCNKIINLPADVLSHLTSTLAGFFVCAG